MATVNDLKEQTGVSGPHPVLLCTCCDASYSANKSDYFMYPGDYVFKCCDKPMVLAVRNVIYLYTVDNG